MTTTGWTGSTTSRTPTKSDLRPAHHALLAAFLLAAACTAPATSVVPADMVVVNAAVHTADPTLPRATAFAVRGGRFVEVGDDASVRALIGPDTEIVDAAAGAVLPGLIDGHVHFGSGLSLVRGVNLYGVADRQEWLRAIAARAAELPEGSWIVGGRWDHTLTPGAALPTREELDAVAPRHPVALSDVDGHSLWVNTLALQLAGVDRTTPDPVGGRILHDADGDPSGVLLEAAELVLGHVPELSDAERRAALAETLAHANSLGITGAHDMAAPPRLDDYLALRREDRLTARIWFGSYGGPDDVDYLAQARERTRDGLREIGDDGSGPWLELGYVKLGIDGVLSTRTAALLQPYADAPSESGLPAMTQEELDALVSRYNAAGFPVAIHSIGDRGVRVSLNAFESSQQANGAPPRPNRIEHIEVLDPADAGRFAALGVLASMNPHHCISGIDKYNTERLGPARAAWSFPWGRLRDAGATLVFGSDWATAPLDPLEQLYAATVREKPAGGPGGGWYPDNRVTWEQALRAYTLEPARAAGWDGETGSITVGKQADFVLLDGAVPAPVDRSLLDLSVLETRVSGRRVYPR